MKKLRRFITSALICTCIFCIAGCSKNNVESFTFIANIYCENELVHDVSVFVNEVEATRSNNGSVELNNLSSGDIITFSKAGYICNERIVVDKNITDYIVHLEFDGFEKVNIKSDIKVDFTVNNFEDGSFKILFDIPKGYLFSGYYIGNILVSSDVNYVFAKDLRKEIEVKFAKLCTVKVLNADCTLIKQLDVAKDTSILLGKYVNKSKVFVGWKCNGEIVSKDKNYSPIITNDETFYLEDEIAYIDYKINDRVVSINTNVIYDLYVDNVLKIKDCNLTEINIANITKSCGNYSVKLHNSNYNIDKCFGISIINDYLVDNAHIVKVENEFYVVLKHINSNYNLSVKVNDIVYDSSNITTEDLTYLCVSNAIIDGYNTLEIATVDKDNIVSEYVNMQGYNKQYNLPKPSYEITKNGLYLLNNDSFNAYLVVNGIILDKITNNQIDISKYINNQLGIMYTKDFTYSSYTSIDVCNQTSSVENNENIKIDKLNNEVYLAIDTFNKSDIKVNINYYIIEYNANQTSINITSFLNKNADNVITINWFENGSNFSKEINYFYECIDTLYFEIKDNKIHIKTSADFYKIYLNNVVINHIFTDNIIDINSYILSTSNVSIRVEGFVDDVLNYRSERICPIEKFDFIEENITIIKSFNSYLFIDKLNDATYYLNDQIINANAIKLNPLEDYILKIVLKNGRIITYEIFK